MSSPLTQPTRNEPRTLRLVVNENGWVDTLELDGQPLTHVSEVQVGAKAGTCEVRLTLSNVRVEVDGTFIEEKEREFRTRYFR